MRGFIKEGLKGPGKAVSARPRAFEGRGRGEGRKGSEIGGRARPEASEIGGKASLGNLWLSCDLGRIGKLGTSHELPNHVFWISGMVEKRPTSQLFRFCVRGCKSGNITTFTYAKN